jgi:hypothetical protein
MLLTCRACGGPIKKENIDVKMAVAKCPWCSALFGVADEIKTIDDVPPAEAAAAPVERPKVPLPDGVITEEGPGQLRLTRRWWSPTLIFLAFFCVVWDSFLIFWYFMAFSKGPGGGFGLLMAAFPCVHVAVGVGLTYATIAGFFNRTTIDVGNGVLSIRHGPVPWPGNIDLHTADIDQIYCTEKTTRGRSGGSSCRYIVNALLKNGRKKKLAANLTEQDQALYIEDRIERFLGIKNQPVAGAIND